jgi:hypothetical protein
MEPRTVAQAALGVLVIAVLAAVGVGKLLQRR